MPELPPAVGHVDSPFAGILDFLRRNDQNNQFSQQLAQQMQANEDWKQAQHDKLAQDEDHWQVTHKAADALQQFQFAEAHKRIDQSNQQMANTYQSGGPTPPGFEVVPGPDDDHIGLRDTSNGAVMYILNPAAHNKLLTSQKAAELQPAADIASKKDQQAQIDEMNKLATQNSYLRDNQDDQNAAAMARTKVEVAGRQAVANTHYGDTGTSPISNFDPTPYTRGALDGTTSQDDIKKLGKDQQDLVNGINSRAGVIPLTEKQKQFVGGMGGAVNVLPLMDQYLDLANNSTRSRLDPTSDDYGKRTQLGDAINEGLTQATSAMMPNVGRLSQPRILQMQTAFSPDRGWNSGIKNPMKRQEYEKNLNAVFDTELGNLSQGQRAHLRQQVGLAAPPTQNPQQIQNPGQTQPAQQQQQPQQPQINPHVQAYANQYFGGDLGKAQTAIQQQQQSTQQPTQ